MEWWPSDYIASNSKFPINGIMARLKRVHDPSGDFQFTAILKRRLRFNLKADTMKDRLLIHLHRLATNIGPLALGRFLFTNKVQLQPSY